MTGKQTEPKSRIHELEAVTNTYAAEISKLEARIGELGSENSRLHAELRNRRGVRAAAHGFYRAVDDAIIARIDRRGFVRKPKKRMQRQIPAEALQSTSMPVLMDAARQYDAGFFRYRTSASGMRLHYRVLSKVYRIGRNITMFGLKKSFKAVRKVVR